MPKIRILLIEDNRILREGIAAVINEHKDLAVVAVSDGRHNSLSKEGMKPHVVLLDLGLERLNSLETVELLKKEFSGVKVIGMGLAPAQSDIMEFVQAGADGFILKDATPGDLVNTIRAVEGGKTVLPSSMTTSLFFQIAEHALLKGRRNLRGATRMTQREKEIIALIVEGMSNKQIAAKLNIATFTVKSHVHNILEKLALHSRLQIANFSRDEKSN
jgi:DNA-binding NarL/FixJ family response regulator